MADKTITDRWKSVQAIASAVYQNDDKAVGFTAPAGRAVASPPNPIHSPLRAAE